MFAQVKFAPLPKTDVNIFLHRFQLFTGNDGRYFGTGAFNRNAIGGFGYGVAPNPQVAGTRIGHHSVGTELDVVVNYKLHENVELQTGYSYMWGNALLNNLSDDDVRFFYGQVTVHYP